MDKRNLKTFPFDEHKDDFEFELTDIETITFPSDNIKESFEGNLEKNGFIVFSNTFENNFALEHNSSFHASYKNHPIEVKITPFTIILKKDVSAGETLYILGVVDNECLAKAIVSKEFYKLFNAFDSTEKKISAMSEFLRLPKSAQESIKQQLSGVQYINDKATVDRISDLPSLKFKFDMCKETYTPQQQRDIRDIIEDCKKFSGSGKERALRRLTYILNINQNFVPDTTMNKEEIIEKLNSHICKHDKLKEMLAEAIIASKHSAIKGFNLLLVGSPGVGKTQIIKAVAAALDIPYFIVQLASSTSLLDIVGDSPQFDASDSGEIVKGFYKAGTTRVVVGLEEFEKASNDSPKEGGKPSKAFTDALSDEHFFKDVFLGTNINTKNTIFIATSNSTDAIPQNLLSRFKIVHLDDYSESDRIDISKTCILPSILSEFDINNDEIIFEDDIIRYISENFCEDSGARDLKDNIKSLIQKVLCIWDSTAREPFIVTKEFINNSLGSFVNENSPGIIYRRNKNYYSQDVANEIKELISKVNSESNGSDTNAELRERYKKKLNYLVNLIPVGNAFSNFNKEDFYNTVNLTHYGMEKVKKEVAQIFNICAINNKPLSSTRLLLVGPPGVGKSSIIKSIAKACNSKYCKVSLNGISDETTLKGHSLSYTGADAGVLIKGINQMQTTKGIVQLDEIDKLTSKNGVANCLIDLLDDSSEFTDNFIGQPVDLTGIMFIATANNISNMDPILLDRFTIITIDGYTQQEKVEITEKYVIPKVISEIVPKDYSTIFLPEAKSIITNTYCRSLGVRDVDKAIRRIIREKLYSSNDKQLIIDTNDVITVLGTPPAERGNFPYETYPGLSKALAVTSNNCGMAFSIETVLIPDDNSLTITGLPKESTIDSVKLAISYVKCRYPGMLSNKGVHIHFGEGSVPKDGPSAGIAILMSLLSAVFNSTITENVAYTGEINANGFVFNIGGTVAKIQAAEQSGCTKVFIPEGNYKEIDKERLEEFKIEVIPVKHVSEVAERIFSIPQIKKLA